jgi:flagellar hook-associated protein 2
MATITSAGVGSGLDISGLVTQLMALERRPIAVLDQKEAGLQAKLSAYGSLKGALSAFQSSVSSLSGVAKFQALSAVSADLTIYTASASSAAVAGSYSIEVTQLAQAHKLASSAFTNTTDSVGTGTLTFQFGTYSGGVFTVNSAKAAQTVTVSSSQNTLAGIRDAVNAAKVGVTATILNDGTGNRLVFTSGDTGAANSLKITVADTSDGSNTDNAGLSRLAYDPTGTLGNGKNLTETLVAQNALLNVDGITGISKASNTVTDVVQGVTLTLLKKSAAGVSTTLTVSRDTSSVQSAVANFVKAYNDLNKAVTDLTKYDAATKKSAVLQGDNSARSIIARVRQQLNKTLTGLTGSYTTLSQIGISFQTNGTLAFDAAKLQTAIDTNFNDIAGLFANIGKPSDSLINYLSATDKTQAGSYSVSITQLATHGALAGVTTASLAHTAGTFTSPFTVDTTNNTLSLKINSVQSGTVTIAQGSYSTAAALVAEIQSKINGDTALKNASKTVTVSFDNATSRLSITSDGYGSDSTVEITSVGTGTASTLGLSAGTGTAGVNAAGSINGVVATGIGQALTGTTGDASEGLKLLITGGATGSRGTVGYSQGYAYQLDKLAGQLLGGSGPIESRTSGINSTIKDIGARRDTMNLHLVDVEKRYRAQFTALDSLVSRMRATSDFLTRQLAILPSPSGSTKG